MKGFWWKDIHLATTRGAAIRELVRIRCTMPFEKWDYYEAADRALRRRLVTYAEIATIINQPGDGIVRMRIRDLRHSPNYVAP